MGREIRKVPANWQHPEKLGAYGKMMLQPMNDQTFEEACSDWKEGFMKWEAGERPDYCSDRDREYWEYEGSPPDREYYRPWRDEEATWFQVWETVSEGTPISPPFVTEHELIDYLAQHGDFWDQSRCLEPDWERIWGGIHGQSGWGLEQAARFVKAAWAPSMILTGNVLVDGKLSV